MDMNDILKSIGQKQSQEKKESCSKGTNDPLYQAKT